MMINKTSFMITLCGAAAMCLSACGAKSEDPTAIEANEPDNSIASARVTPAPADSAGTGDAAIEASAEKPGTTPPSVDEIPTKSIKAAEPVKDDPPAPTKPAEVKVPKPVAAQAPVVEKTVVAAVRPASFGQCAVCHSDKQGQKSGFGPNLYGIAGTKAGAVSGYAFSAAMTSSGVLWNRENLDAFLLSPQSRIPGTKMSFSGVKDAAKRKEIVDYIIGLK
jgi:cytochrome c